ncbi:MAG: DUF374 domain-containing protein [Candidatus Obscuribacterales bacterium]|nr:DUF374 domain-containing protein [Candidatus Obscuribacterales bacterium]
MKKFRLRNLFLKYPLLDKARVLGLAKIFKYGITAYDLTYRPLAIIPEASRPYVSCAGADTTKRPVHLKPAIYAYFHGQMYLLLALSPRHSMSLIASNSRDGEMIARAGEGMGFTVVRGSKTEGGAKGARGLLENAQEGKSILFPVDGPRGPFQVVKPEIIRLASMTGLPIIPLVGEARTRDLMKSWDKYNCPYMHTRQVRIYGTPIHVPADMDKQLAESLRVRLETTMVELKAKASDFYLVCPKTAKA